MRVCLGGMRRQIMQIVRCLRRCGPSEDDNGRAVSFADNKPFNPL